MATSCVVRYTQTGGSPSDAYGNSPDSDNQVTLYYRDLKEGTMWGSGDTLSMITFYPSAGLTGSGGVIFSNGQWVTTSWYMVITCNGTSIRCPGGSGTYSTGSSSYYGYGYPYNGFTWSSEINITIKNGADITVQSGSIANFLAGVKNLSTITYKIYFPNNSNYRIIDNATGEITSWETNTAPTTPTINYPVSGKITYNTKPRFSMSGTDADGNTLTYQYSMNNSSWTDLASGLSSGTTKTGQVSSSQSTGSKTLYVRTYDGKAYSSVASRSFTIGTTSLGTTTDSTIDNATIDNAQSYITNIAAYYGNTAPSWTICNRSTELSASQISELNTGLKALTPGQSFTVPSAGAACDASLFATTINNAIKNS